MHGQTSGILLIDKEDGATSFDIVKRVKTAFGGRTAPKIGHSGTLDPFATGLLVILVGQGTKLSSYVMDTEKVYRATMKLGEDTDTLDPTGTVVRTRPVPQVDLEHVRTRAEEFVGRIRQLPPAYSALKVRGTRAYSLARKGLEVDLAPREVSVHFIRILLVDLPHVTMEVGCSSGTYVRSLAADLAAALGTAGHLASLRRLASGPFGVEEALGSEVILKEKNPGALRERVIPMRDALPHLTGIDVDAALADRVRHGYQPAFRELPGAADAVTGGDGYSKLTNDGELVAIVRISEDREGGHGTVKVKRVFV